MDTKHLDANAAFRALEEAADVLREKRKVARSLNNAKRILLAKLARASGEPSDEKRKDAALASDEYAEFLEGLEAAETERDAAELHYQNLRSLARLRQSEESTRRALAR